MTISLGDILLILLSMRHLSKYAYDMLGLGACSLSREKCPGRDVQGQEFQGKIPRTFLMIFSMRYSFVTSDVL